VISITAARIAAGLQPAEPARIAGGGMAMTRTRKLLRIALVALIAGGGMAVAVRAAKSPVAVARIAHGSHHACVEGSFESRWNVPGQSTCDAD
jgi:hypothetical protein